MYLSDSDSKMAMAIGYSDRVVRQWEWQAMEDEDSSTVLGGKIVQVERWQLAGQVSGVEELLFVSCTGYCSQDVWRRKPDFTIKP